MTNFTWWRQSRAEHRQRAEWPPEVKAGPLGVEEGRSLGDQDQGSPLLLPLAPQCPSAG